MCISLLAAAYLAVNSLFNGPAGIDSVRKEYR